MDRLPVETRAKIIGCLVEGMSMRATTRIVGCSINTITKLLVDLGTACAICRASACRLMKSGRSATARKRTHRFICAPLGMATCGRG